jgi:hypothetical protein
MYFYSGVVAFDFPAAGGVQREKVLSFVPCPGPLVVNHALDPQGLNHIESKTCAASLNTFGGSPVLAGVDDAEVQLHDFTGQVPGHSGPIHLLVLVATVAAAHAVVLRLGYHVTVVTTEEQFPPKQFPPTIGLPGNFEAT